MDEAIAWTYNNAWTQQDFKSCTWEDQPTLVTAKGGLECNSLIFNLWELKRRNAVLETGLWMYLETKTEKQQCEVNGNNEPGRRTKMQQKLNDRIQWQCEVNGNNEPGRRTEEKQNLSNRIQWQSEVGNGANLQYLQKGIVTENNEITVVKDLTYDLYAAVAAAKRGFSCVLDYTEKEKGIVTEINEIEEMKLAANEEIDKTEDEINGFEKQKHRFEKRKHEFE